jgi:hypothetical protein
MADPFITPERQARWRAENASRLAHNVAHISALKCEDCGEEPLLVSPRLVLCIRCLSRRASSARAEDAQGSNVTLLPSTP